MAVLTFEQNASAIIDRKDDDRTRVPHHVAARANAPGLFNLIGGDVEHRPFINDAGGEDACLGAPGSFRVCHVNQYTVMCCSTTLAESWQGLF